MSEFFQHGYKLQRAASHGAQITLVSGCGTFTARFECASKCAEVLGKKGLEDVGDGLIEYIPKFTIPTEDLKEALEKLSQRFSVALVEFVRTERNGERYVCLWRIAPAKEETKIPPPASLDLDDY